MNSVPSSRQPNVEGPYASTNQQQKDQSQKHAEIRAAFVQRSPKSVLRECNDFGRIYGNSDINEKRYRRQPRNETDQQQRATNNLDHPTNGAMTLGQGILIFAKRPTPRESGNKNFCVPSERKTQPTRM